MKAVILAGGRGKRLREVTEPYNANKCMLEFNSQPLIKYSLDAAGAGHIKEAIVVVGYRAEDIINTYGICYKDIRIRYVIQQEQKGLVHAIEQCQEYLENEDFILFLGDEILVDPSPMEMIKKFKREKLFVICGVTRVEDLSQIKKTYAIIYNQDNHDIYRLIEKPRNPINSIMGTGNCIFKNEIFKYIPYTPINQTRHEKELPDLIQCAIDDGKPVKLFQITSHYININTPDEIKQAERLFKENVYQSDS
jgi:NDP-sugar pyrophosphorylase family protein